MQVHQQVSSSEVVQELSIGAIVAIQRIKPIIFYARDSKCLPSSTTGCWNCSCLVALWMSTSGTNILKDTLSLSMFRCTTKCLIHNFVILTANKTISNVKYLRAFLENFAKEIKALRLEVVLQLLNSYYPLYYKVCIIIKNPFRIILNKEVYLKEVRSFYQFIINKITRIS